jgi:hypothetical protein
MKLFSSSCMKVTTVEHRVARWCIFKPKIPTWVNFEWHFNGRCWYILWPCGLTSDHLNFLWPFCCTYCQWVYFSVLVCGITKNLATLVEPLLGPKFTASPQKSL